VIAVSRQETYEYVLLEEQGEAAPAYPTIWRYAPLTLIEASEIRDLLGLHARAEGIPLGSMERKLLRKLTGWSNFRDEQANEVAWEKGQDGFVLESLLVRIPADARAELASEIWKTRGITKEEEKNLLSQSR
jgi:hypothetical protein